MNTNKVKLFCIPGGGASAYVYLKYTKYLTRNIKLCLLELPGRGLRKKESPLTDFQMVVDDLYLNLTEELKKDPDCDYMLLGYCYGGILAYELYRKIRKEGGKEPFHIFMSATNAIDVEIHPLFGNEEARGEVQDLLTTYFPEHIFRDKEIIAEVADRYVDCLYRQYRESGTTGTVTYDDIFHDEAEDRRLGRITAGQRFEVDKCIEFANETVKVIDSDLQNVIDYKQTERRYTAVDCDLTIFSGEGDMLTPIDSVKGWIRLAGKNFHLYVMPGGHRMLLDHYAQCMVVINQVVKDFNEKNE